MEKMTSINQVKFIKASAPFNTQVQIIQGMFLPSVDNDIKVINKLLSEHGLYRLKGYIKPLLKNHNGKRFCDLDIRAIQDIIEIDISLRKYLLTTILRIENMLTLKISEKMCSSHNPYWIFKQELFTSESISKEKYTERHEEIVKKLRNDTRLEYGQHPHPGVVSYAKKHDPDHLPSWILRECSSFGTWCNIFESMSNNEKTLVCEIFKLKKENSKSRFTLSPKAFASWMRSLRILRNTCAHNGILINKVLTHSPSPNESVPSIGIKGGPNILERLKVIYCFLSMFSNEESLKFNQNIKDIIYKYNTVYEKILKRLFGFDEKDLQ